MEEKDRYMGQDSLYGTGAQTQTVNENYGNQTDMSYENQRMSGTQRNTDYDIRQMSGTQRDMGYDAGTVNGSYENSMNQNGGNSYGGNGSQYTGSYGNQNFGNSYYGNQGYGGQGTPQYPYGTNKPDPGNGFGIASLILGIVSFLLFCTCMNWITGILAVIFGIVQIAKGGQKGLAIGGIVSAAISMLLCLILYFFLGIASYKDYYDYYDYYHYNTYEEDPYQEMYPAVPGQGVFEEL